jgi:hypothetical protein
MEVKVRLKNVCKRQHCIGMHSVQLNMGRLNVGQVHLIKLLKFLDQILLPRYICLWSYLHFHHAYFDRVINLDQVRSEVIGLDLLIHR